MPVEPTTEHAPNQFSDAIEWSRRDREIALSLPVPTVIFSDDLDAVGRALTLAASASDAVILGFHVEPTPGTRRENTEVLAQIAKLD